MILGESLESCVHTDKYLRVCDREYIPACIYAMVRNIMVPPPRKSCDKTFEQKYGRKGGSKPKRKIFLSILEKTYFIEEKDS